MGSDWFLVSKSGQGLFADPGHPVVVSVAELGHS